MVAASVVTSIFVLLGMSALVTHESIKVAKRFGGISSVGVFVDGGRDIKEHNCTGAVIESPGGGIVITAAHCGVQAGKTRFIPGYDGAEGSSGQPFGIWDVDRTWTDPRFSRTPEGEEFDFMFVRLRPNSAGAPIATVTGANSLRSGSWHHDGPVTVIGYPWRRKNPADLPVRCTAGTGTLPGGRYLRMSCDGYASGVSGGPWLSNFDGMTGEVIGVTGGKGGGGPVDWITYSPVFGEALTELYVEATHGRQ
ncbi:trypsin-like serine peptidase [Kitasatospora sp. NPDC059747]|uniref:trypsin-like serine peptidase n=1 Tax=Kitasatospora sp. NPDC059747 TaxID=3346930 RepID=UPI003656062C